MPRVVFISDTHSRHQSLKVPEGDIIIHCGDFSYKGTQEELLSFIEWYSNLPHSFKVFIAGNHDWCFERENEASRKLVRGAIYLQDSGVQLMDLKIYGSPWQPWHRDWAFNLERGRELAYIWSKIPEDTDILVTHGPPYGILDRVTKGELVGCEDLLARVREVGPKVHAFGHIHEAYGRFQDGTIFLNVCVCDRYYRPFQRPVVIDTEEI